MANRQPESVLVHAIRRTIEAAYPNAYVQKNHGSMYQAAGIPDLFVFVDGKTYALEVKRQRPGETVDQCRARCTPLQMFTMMKFRKAGIPADCVTSPAEAMAILSGHPPFLQLNAQGRPVVKSIEETS